jgi:hypothetical protein
MVTDLVKQLRDGADFAELAKKNSEDKNSAASGGDFGVLRRGDRIPEEIKTAVFALKPGEVSDPDPSADGLLHREAGRPEYPAVRRSEAGGGGGDPQRTLRPVDERSAEAV